MLKNNRPYSVENGYIDDALITDHSIWEINEVMKWIKENVRRSRKILYGRTSYGIKHKLQHDTGIYLTNNEFKDAMMYMGYYPVNPDELNWRYRIVLTKEINDNPNPFFKWAKQFEGQDSNWGDFADDMINDFEFPMIANSEVIERYLEWTGACRDAILTFEEMWDAYAGEDD